MQLGKAFFDLQLRFAHRVATLAGMPLAQALLDYTNLYVRWGMGREFDATHPVWQAYLCGLASSCTANQNWTWHFYQGRRAHDIPAPAAASVGCFAYVLAGPGHIRLHFHNSDASGQSPLAASRREHRAQELAALFDLVQRNEPPGVRVLGTSWLYQIEAYRRLFPAGYLATAVPVQRFRNMPLWGQFLDRHGALKPEITEPFVQRVERAADLQGLTACFALQPLALDAPVEVFWSGHGIAAGTLQGPSNAA